MHWYLDVLKKYTAFGGRARRQEYWMFVLFHVIVAVVLLVAETMAGGPGILYALYLIGTILPSLAVSVRRLHDTGRSGWWLLLSLVPFGSIVVFIFTVMDSQPGTNRFGPNPKEAVA